MNNQNILKFFGSRLDVRLDSSEYYDYELSKTELDYDTDVLDLSKPIVYSSLKIDDSLEDFCANVIKINSEESYNQFLKNYPYAIQVSDVIKKRDEIAYSNVLKVNTIEAFSKVIKNYPKALQIKDVTDRRDIMANDVAVNLNTEQSYDEFVKKYHYKRLYLD